MPRSDKFQKSPKNKVQMLRQLFEEKADAEHAAFHKNYHKSSKDFYGLYTKDLSAAFDMVFPKKVKLDLEEAMPLALKLWSSNWFEEQSAGLLLL